MTLPAHERLEMLVRDLRMTEDALEDYFEYEILNAMDMKKLRLEHKYLHDSNISIVCDFISFIYETPPILYGDVSYIVDQMFDE